MGTYLYVAFAVSGFSGLIYESIWTHYLKLFLGHAAYAQSLVLAIFMGGMAVGAALAGRWSSRLRNPLRAYALAEGAIGILALIFHVVFTHALDLSFSTVIPALGSVGLVTAFKWSLGALMILPQSILLGATFPLMAAGLMRVRPDARGFTVAMLYFTNSLGGAVGVLASGFLLIRALGLPGTIALAGAINLLLCAYVWRVSGRQAGGLEEPVRGETASVPGRLPILMLAAAAVTGAASFVYEIAWIRLLTLVLGASTHAFELMLSAFILGLAFGGLWIRRRIDGIANPRRYLAMVQVAMGALAVATLPLYGGTFALMQRLLGVLPKTDGGYALFNLASDGIAMAIMLPATFCAGMTLPLVTLALLKGNHGERSIGAVYSANTLGSIAGVILAVHVGMPFLGLKGLLAFGAGLDIALGVLLVWAPGGGASSRMRIALPAVGAVAIGTTLALVHLDPLQLASGVYRNQGLLRRGEVEILEQRDGKTATIHLLKASDGTLFLRTNGKTDAAISMARTDAPRPDEATMTLAGALPMLLKPEARSAANIGLGSGLTAQTLLSFGSLRTVDTIEIEQAVVEAARGFRPRTDLVYTDPRSHIWIDDAKSFFSSYNRRYDIIVSEPSNPWVSGVSGLFSKEFYRQIRRYLAEDGVFVQWLQLYETDTDLVLSVLKAVNENFRSYEIYAMNDVDIMVVASEAEHVPRPPSSTLATSPFFPLTARVGVRTPGDLDLRWVADRASLEPLLEASGVPANSDYHPYLDQRAARARFLQRTAAEMLMVDEGLGVASRLGSRVPLAGRTEAEPTTAVTFFSRANKARAAGLFAAAVESVPPGSVPPALAREPQVVAQPVWELLAGCAAPPQDGRDALLFRIGVEMMPFLRPERSERMWDTLASWPCGAGLGPEQAQWVALFRAVGRRDPGEMVARGTQMLGRVSSRQPILARYALGAALLGYEMRGDRSSAGDLWVRHREQVFGKEEPPLVFRLLAAHAEQRR